MPTRPDIVRLEITLGAVKPRVMRRIDVPVDDAYLENEAEEARPLASAERVKPTWRDVEAELDCFDRAGLLGLIKDLHGASRDNEVFLNARLGLGSDPMEPYRKRISRWICPDVMRGQNVSVARAKKAVSDYRKAIGLPKGVAELSTFYCEEAFGLLSWCGMDDEGYYAALVRMFERALTAVESLPVLERASFHERLDPLRTEAGDLGWGVKVEFDELWHSIVECRQE